MDTQDTYQSRSLDRLIEHYGLPEAEAADWVYRLGFPAEQVMEWRGRGYSGKQAQTIMAIDFVGAYAWRASNFAPEQVVLCVEAGLTLEAALAAPALDEDALRMLAALRVEENRQLIHEFNDR